MYYATGNEETTRRLPELNQIMDISTRPFSFFKTNELKLKFLYNLDCYRFLYLYRVRMWKSEH